MPVGKASRAAIRFPLQTPVSFWWTDENGEHRIGKGESRDISERGAFVFSTTCPPLGALVRFRIAELADADGIDVTGRVVRVEKHTPKEIAGFAVLSEFPDNAQSIGRAGLAFANRRI